MRVLVTGGSGYIGAVLVPWLHLKGHQVTVVDLQPTIGEADEFVAGDIRDMRLIQPILHRVDVVIPLAGVVGAPACANDQYGATTINRYAIRDLLSRLSRDQRVIFPATDSGYPSGKVDETSPMAPVSLYAQTKYAAECAVLDHGGVTLRLASVFGVSPRMRWDLIVNNFVDHAVNGDTLDLYEPYYERSFCHVRDVATAFDRAITLEPGAYNVGDTLATMTKLKLCELIKRHIPSFNWYVVADRRDPDRRDAVVSYAKIEAFGWRPEHGIHFGVNELIASARSAI